METGCGFRRPIQGGPRPAHRQHDSALKERTHFLAGEPSPRKRETSVWGRIDAAFAEPTTLSDDFSEYVPTQIIGEVFRDAGFDGVAYRSSYGKGHNICLFDPNNAEHVNCFLVRVDDIKYRLSDEEQFSYTVEKQP